MMGLFNREPTITKREHEEIVAKLNGDLIAERMITEDQRKQLQRAAERHKMTEIAACNLASECNWLKARLAVFTAPRARQADDRFVKGEGK